ncbi:helix-turn-helix domain-containing protein [Aneurinibacillus aneurinilyticus]|uniref:helix-turn-helix domain-containing protein n=1 Tax=Aneurinibacillus aneurinilyticus TaxID=1391 RepID=UPI003523386D
MNFGEYIKKLREERDLSVRELARRSNVSIAHISQTENGHRGIPKPETLKKLAEGLNHPVEDLMTKAGYLDESEFNTVDLSNHEFPKRLRKYREECKLSIDELAEKVNLTPHTIERFEDGRGGLPGQKTLDKLASILEVTRDYLLGYTNDPKGYGVGTYDTDPKNLKAFIENNRSLGFDGDELELDEEEQEELLRHTRLAWMMIKEKRQEKAKKRK